MRRIVWPSDNPPDWGRSVVTLGVFDGVHRGHGEVIARTVEAARQRSCPSVVVTFDRHPAAVVHGRPEPAITSLEHRLRLFESMGAKACVVVRFDRTVARMPAGDFVREVLQEFLAAELVVLGFNCRFGRDGQGDAAVCRRLGARMGFEVEEIPPVELDGQPVSSTAIRRAIQEGRLRDASRLLARPFALYGTVVRGEGRGRGLGYPTANLDLHNEITPPEGVYAALVQMDGETMSAVASVGRRETFHPERTAAAVVEVHVIDYAGSLYGREMEVQFVSRLREQRAYATARELAAQIGMDIAETRRVLQEG